MTSPWKPLDSAFDFSALRDTDMVDIRISMDVTTTVPNQEIFIDLVSAIGLPGEFRTPFVFTQTKT